MEMEWEFKGGRLAGYGTLIDCYPDTEFDSPTRSTVALLDYCRSPEQCMRELHTALGLSVPARVLLNFEYTLSPRRGIGKPSQTDLMVISRPELAIAIEAKWTEPRYETVGTWLGDSPNRSEVLRGWCELLEQRGAKKDLEEDLHRLPYQMVHRAASACHVKDVSSCWVVYLVFKPTASKRSEYLADLTCFRDVLGSRSSLGIALAECSIEQSESLIELRRRWDDAGERQLNVPVRQCLKTGGLLRAQLEQVHCLTA